MIDGMDIGHDQTVVRYVNSDEVWVGLIHFHPKPDGSRCNGGAILFDIPENDNVPDRAKWQVVSLDPLRLEPSLLCTVCGNHGFIRAGRWVPA